MFRTELPLTPHSQQLPLSAQVLTVGSCFSDAIGGRLAAAKVNTLVNPFGTVFNPLSACQLLRAAAGEEIDWQQHLVEARGRWQSYDLHATIGADSPVALLQHIQALVQEVGTFLQNTDVVVLTLGTAYAYRLLETDEVVNNCHKVPGERFEKVLLTPDEIINAVAETHAYLRRSNPKLRFILTVSPVRHLKDTLPLNSVSKSVLRVACHYLSELLPDVSYFPAYELLLDDLRDYRFYAADMLHPSEVAENYIWERFTRTYFDAAFGRFRKEWEAVRQALGHRPLYPEASEHREFLEATLARLQRLSAQTDVGAESQEIQQQLAALPVPKAQPLPEIELDDDEERIDIGEPTTPPREPRPARPLREAAEAAVPVAAPITAVTSSVMVDEPDAEDTDEEVEEESEESAETTLGAESSAFPKKKRRSRGGAKRTARKKAAQLYAQQAAEAATGTPTAATTGSELEEAPFTAQPEAEHNTAPPVEVAPVAEPEPVVFTPPSAPVAAQVPPPRPVAGRPVPVRPVSEPKPNVDWLQLMDEESEETPAATPKEQKPPARGKASRQVAEKKPRATKDRIITTPPSRSRKKPAPLYAEAPTPAEAAPVETVILVEAAPVAPVISAPLAEVLPVASAPVEAVVPEPVEALIEGPAAPVAVKKPRAKAASKVKTPKAAPKEAVSKPAVPKAAKKATKVAPAPEPPKTEEPTAVAPKKRSRPPRKKPTPTDETPLAS